MDIITIEIISGVAVTVATALILGLLAAGTSYINKAKTAIVERTKNTKYETVTYFVTQVVADALQAVAIDLAAEIKEKAADGTLTSEEISEIVISAKTIVAKNISESVQLDLIELVGDWDGFIETKVRSYISTILPKK